MATRDELLVTTSHKARPDAHLRAARFAAGNDLPFYERNDEPIEVLLEAAKAALVFTNTDVHVATGDGRLSFHLGTAYIRLKSIERGESDPLLRAGDLRPGDHILDTTFGLGRDSIVAARIVGPSGKVDAIESSAALFHLADLSIHAFQDPQSAVVDVRSGDARDLLAAMESHSVDVVLVDPMFTTPKASDSGFALLRDLADPTPLDQRWIHEARRVARRVVVLKAGEPMPWFDDEQLVSTRSYSNATWFRSPALTAHQ